MPQYARAKASRSCCGQRPAVPGMRGEQRDRHGVAKALYAGDPDADGIACLQEAFLCGQSRSQSTLGLWPKPEPVSPQPQDRRGAVLHRRPRAFFYSRCHRRP